jgi:hypothetical protein
VSQKSPVAPSGSFENSREKAQRAQKRGAFFALFAPFRGYLIAIQIEIDV